MPWDCGFLCLLSEKRRYTEILWRKQLLITADERKAKRRFQSLMKGFDTEDLDVLRRVRFYTRNTAEERGEKMK